MYLDAICFNAVGLWCLLSWSGRSMVRGDLQRQSVLLIWNLVGQGSTMLAIGADTCKGFKDVFSCLSCLFLFFLPFSGRQPNIDLYKLSQRAVKPQTNQPTNQQFLCVGLSAPVIEDVLFVLLVAILPSSSFSVLGGLGFLIVVFPKYLHLY